MFRFRKSSNLNDVVYSAEFDTLNMVVLVSWSDAAGSHTEKYTYYQAQAAIDSEEWILLNEKDGFTQ